MLRLTSASAAQMGATAVNDRKSWSKRGDLAATGDRFAVEAFIDETRSRARLFEAKFRFHIAGLKESQRRETVSDLTSQSINCPRAARLDIDSGVHRQPSVTSNRFAITEGDGTLEISKRATRSLRQHFVEWHARRGQLGKGGERCD